MEKIHTADRPPESKAKKISSRRGRRIGEGKKSKKLFLSHPMMHLPKSAFKSPILHPCYEACKPRSHFLIKREKIISILSFLDCISKYLLRKAAWKKFSLKQEYT